MKYLVVIEKGEHNYSAYIPDLPGCIVAGETIQEIKELMNEAIIMHLEGMREDGEPIPEPSIFADYWEEAA